MAVYCLGSRFRVFPEENLSNPSSTSKNKKTSRTQKQYLKNGISLGGLSACASLQVLWADGQSAHSSWRASVSLGLGFRVQGLGNEAEGLRILDLGFEFQVWTAGEATTIGR